MHDRGKRLPVASHLQDKTTVFAAEHEFFVPVQFIWKIVNLPDLIKKTNTFDYSQNKTVQVLYSLYWKGFLIQQEASGFLKQTMNHKWHWYSMRFHIKCPWIVTQGHSHLFVLM